VMYTAVQLGRSGGVVLTTASSSQADGTGSVRAPEQEGAESEYWLEETLRSYDSTAHEYATRFEHANLDAYIWRFLRLLPNGDHLVLDAGCGSGRDCRSFQWRGLPVIGVDLSAGLLHEARRVTTASLIQTDLRRLPIADNVVSGIWACASLVHLKEPVFASAVGEFLRVLKPGGVLFVSVRPGIGTEWRRDSRGGRRFFQLYEPREIEAALRAVGFKMLSIALEPGYGTSIWINAFARAAK
jgi:SAM-dependent methyltransferase